MKRREGLRAWLLYAAVRVVVGFLRCFPINLNLVGARWIGRLWWRTVRKHRERTRRHVRLAMGDALSDQEVDRLARGSLEQLAMFAVEFLFVPSLITQWTWNRYIRLGDMREAIRVLLDGKGALLLTGHFGNWELAGYLLAVLGFDVAAIMRPLDNVYLNRYVVNMRRRRGLDLIDKKGAMASVESVVNRGAALGFIADQSAGSKGLFVDFFGAPASTYKSIGLLAMSAEVPIIIGYAHRVSPRFRYEVGVERIIYPREWKDKDDPLVWITQTYTSAIEASIRRAPEQYLWLHRRWKSRPRRQQHRRHSVPVAHSQPPAPKMG